MYNKSGIVLSTLKVQSVEHHNISSTKLPRPPLLLLCLLLIVPVLSLDNGLARTPPMGWLAWERFRCNTNCERDPNNCVSERLFLEMADRLLSDGFRDAGYNHINIDDCWMSHKRGLDGRLVPDPKRFPNGILYLANQMHSRGLKLGIYEDFGRLTCMGYPGIVGHMELDARTFAEWDVDYVKLDGCHSHPKDMDKGYMEMGQYLNKTGKQMVYACSWPFYQIKAGMEPNYTRIAHHCNLWRNFDDIQDSWSSILSIIDFYGDNQEVMVPHAKPGSWNDPDMLIIGNFGLSYDQSKVQMGMWAIFAAPLLMSNDLRNLRSEFREILTNKGVIAINQDPLGKQGKRVYKNDKIEIWLRPITPTLGDEFSYAVAFLNRRADGLPTRIRLAPKDLGLTHLAGYRVTDAFTEDNYGLILPHHNFAVSVNPTGIAVLRAALVDEEDNRLV